MKNKKTESLFLENLSKSELEFVLNTSRLNTKMKNDSIKILGAENFCEVRVIKETPIKHLYPFFRLIGRLQLIKENENIKSSEKLTSTCPDLFEALLFYKKGVNHFYDRINIDNSYMDAEAIAFMNESLLKIDIALKKTTENEITLTINTVPQITVISKIPEKTKYFKNEIVIVKLLFEPNTEIDMEFSDFYPAMEFSGFTPTIDKKNFLFITDQKTSPYTFLTFPMTESIIMDLTSKKID